MTNRSLLRWVTRASKLSSAAAAIAGAIIGFSTLDTVLGADLTTYSVAGDPHALRAAAQAPQLQQQETSPTPIAPIGLLSPTILITATVSPSATLALTPTATPSTTVVARGSEPTATVTPEAELTETPAAEFAGESGVRTATATPVTTTVAEESPTVDAGPVRGTIVSNRSQYAARFFLEGQMFQVGPASSEGIDLPRVTAILNLYSCAATTPETQEGCYWDPYLLQRDGFYEIFDESTIQGLPNLMLRDADTPPANQVWVHNRTGQEESVVFRDAVHQLASATVTEFDVEPGAPVILYVRSCARLDDQEVCEWAPQSLDPGAYYAMVEVSMPGGIPGSRIVAVDLRRVVDKEGQAIAAATEVVCQLRVPAINVRSGPGLQYQIVGKVREGIGEPGRVAVAGRSADSRWLAVAESVAPNGWVTSDPDFVACRGNTEDLPLAEFRAPDPVPVAPAGPTQDVEQAEPAPAPAGEQQAVEEIPPADVSEVVTDVVESQGPAIPEGLSLLVVNNGFQYPVRFTLDQRFRPIEGPSEFDLEPSASTQIVVFPGSVSFTVSSPWNSLSGNANLEIEADQALTLWLRFEPDPDGSSNWELAWQ